MEAGGALVWPGWLHRKMRRGQRVSADSVPNQLPWAWCVRAMPRAPTSGSSPHIWHTHVRTCHATDAEFWPASRLALLCGALGLERALLPILGQCFRESVDCPHALLPGWATDCFVSQC